jgi:hypothetical protein
VQRGYILVEGHGEVDAIGNLVTRLWKDGHGRFHWAPPLRWKNLHQQSGVGKGANYVRVKGDAAALLVIRDEDDACPRDTGPQMASWLSQLNLPFPAALVLLHPEYEVLFLPCIEDLAGKLLASPTGTHRPGIIAGARWDGHTWESKRGIKQWLTSHYPPNRSYKPTTDQLALTRMLDLGRVRSGNVPCFGTLERALSFLASEPGPGSVYPPPTPTAEGR